MMLETKGIETSPTQETQFPSVTGPMIKMS
jgi:hypothetical protein